MSNEQSKSWVVVVVAVVVGVGFSIWAVSGRSRTAATEPLALQEEPTAAPAAEKRPAIPSAAKAAAATDPTKPASPAAVEQPATPRTDSDLFAGPMPDFMVDLHARVLDKKNLNVNMQKQLYFYGQEHKDDARPQLILAWDARNRDWDGIAISMYRIAYKADPRAKDDPSMLPDLVRYAGTHDRVEFEEANELIAKAYGAEALPYVEEQLDKANSANDYVRATRLSKVRDKIRSQ